MSCQILLMPETGQKHYCLLPDGQLGGNLVVSTIEENLGMLAHCQCGKYWHVYEFMERFQWGSVRPKSARRLIRQRRKANREAIKIARKMNR